MELFLQTCVVPVLMSTALCMLAVWCVRPGTRWVPLHPADVRQQGLGTYQRALALWTQPCMIDTRRENGVRLGVR